MDNQIIPALPGLYALYTASPAQTPNAQPYEFRPVVCFGVVDGLLTAHVLDADSGQVVPVQSFPGFVIILWPRPDTGYGAEAGRVMTARDQATDQQLAIQTNRRRK